MEVENVVSSLGQLVERIQESLLNFKADTWLKILEQCQTLVTHSDDANSIVILQKCSIVASDILVRLHCIQEASQKSTIDQTILRVWSNNDLVVLNQRISAIQHELDSQRNDTGNRSSTTMSTIIFDFDDDSKPIKTKKKSKTVASYDSGSERFLMLRDFLLDALAFTAMNDREEQVTEAYSDTFDWIFRDESHGFANWLQKDEAGSMYWINGWAGSGKSTLMRYINEQKRTRALLKQWGSEQGVVIANFFFWESGTAVQRSQAGLIRSLLHQLLTQIPDIIPDVFSELWSEIWEGDARTRIRLTSTWPIARLTDAFRRFFQVKKEMKICLLVDGLDEFEGDHQTMIDLLRHVCQQPNTKVCVSSRPWSVFEQAFHDVPALRVQDLTASDMTRFVRGKLQEDARLSKLLLKEPDVAAELVNIMVQQADGVFLWVSLAVRTLMQKATTGESLTRFRDRLQKLPRSLDELFNYLLFQSQANFAPKLSRIFQLMRAREVVCDFTRDDDATSLTIWEMALTEENAKEASLTASVHKVKDEERMQHCTQTIENITQSCAGLVEVHPSRMERQRGLKLKPTDFNPFLTRRKISYLHRTVKDFLANKQVWQSIVAHAPDLDPHLCHLRASVLRFKLSLQKPIPRRDINEWWTSIVLAMTHARYALAASRQETFDLLNAFDETLNWYWPPRGSVAADSWARSCFGTYEERGFKLFPEPFLSLTTKFGITTYVEDYLDTYEYEYQEEKPLLSFAVEYLVHRQSSVYPFSSPDLIGILFKNGEDPNLIKQPARDIPRDPDDEDAPKLPKQLKTPWVIALEAVQQAHRRGWIERYDIELDGVSRWTKILRLFLENGADPHVKLQATYKDSVETALELITRLFDIYYSRDIKDVRDMLLAKIDQSA